MYVAIWPSTRRNTLPIVIFLMSSIILIYYYSISAPLNTLQSVLTDTVDDAFFVKTPGCRISRMDPFDASILDFLGCFEVKCESEKGPPLLKLVAFNNSTKNLESNNHAEDENYYSQSHISTSNEAESVDNRIIKLVVIESGFQHYNVSPEDRSSSEPKFSCTWQSFNRKTPDPKEVDRGIDDAIVYGEMSQTFTDFSLIPPHIEFLRVICHLNETEIYKDAFFIPTGNPSIHPPPNTPSPPGHGVLLFALDAVSRLNFIREMPLFHQFLREHGAIDFIGYHKVGDNTFPNLVPLVTGLSEGEIQKGCWPNHTSFFDKCPFVWKEYQSKGFLTAFVEDEPGISGFNYLKNGFQNQPTDYYLRPLYLEKQRDWGHSAGHGSNTRICMGQDLNVKFLLGKVTQILFNAHRSKFGFFWQTSLTHDYSCLPRLGDKIYKDFFDVIANAGILENNFILVLSDHGLRWGDIRNTYQGRIEERMPFMFLMPPPWFKNKFPLAYQNLKRNSNKLTTPYDVHATMQDLLDLEKISNSAILEREANLSATYPIPQAYSLFTPVSSARTCASAHIPADYCVCHDAISKLPNNDPHAIIAATATVDHLNSLLANSTLCAKLNLHKVRHVQVERSLLNKTIAAENSLEFWSLSLETVPGNGLFEATLRRRGEENFEVVGTVSRTNLYRGQSDCMDDYHLRLYCYCV